MATAFSSWERKYKVEAHELATAILGRAVLEPLLAAGEFTETCRRAMQVVNKTNLIFPNEKMSLKDGLKPAGGQEAFRRGAVSQCSTVRTRYSRGSSNSASVLDRLGAAKWTVVTYFSVPAVSRPASVHQADENQERRRHLRLRHRVYVHPCLAGLRALFAVLGLSENGAGAGRPEAARQH